MWKKRQQNTESTYCFKKVVCSTGVAQESIWRDNAVRIILVTPQMVTGHKVTGSCGKEQMLCVVDYFLYMKCVGQDYMHTIRITFQFLV